MRRSPRTTALLAAMLSLGILATAGCRSIFDGIAHWPGGAISEEAAMLADKLRHDQWTPNVAWTPMWDYDGFPIESRPDSKFRWTHPELTSALESVRQTGRTHTTSAVTPTRIANGTARDELLDELSRRHDLPGWNAAILWARTNPRSAAAVESTLRQLVLNPPHYAADVSGENRGSSPRLNSKSAAPRDSGASANTKRTTISLNMQAAAAEAWCLVLATKNEDPELALAPAGQALASGKLPDKIAQELIRGIARHVPPSRIPSVAEQGFQSKAAEVTPALREARRAAIDACLMYAIGHSFAKTFNCTPNYDGNAAAFRSVHVPLSDDFWPAGLWDCEHDPDARLRSRFCEFVAVTRHPDALRILQDRFHDQDQDVREAAQIGLGLFGGDEAWSILRDLAKRNEERTRQIAVRSLSFRGPIELRAFMDDKSPRVRAEVARCLGRFPSQETSRLLRELQSDPNLEVQMTAVDSLADWSDVLAIPLLLQSLAESSLRTRQFALAELEHRRGGGLPFPLYADPQERAVRAKQWAVEWQLPDTLVSAIQELSQPGNARLDAIRLAELRDRIGTLRGPLTGESRTAETNRLLPELTAADVSLLEILLSEVNESQRDLLLHEILPRLSPAYDALVQLEEPDSRRRQAAATKLAQIGADISLSPVLLQHLQRLMRQEQDRLVWRSVMQAVTPDASDQAGQLALLAINSTWPDVRVLGCDYVARHGQSEQAVWLLPLLHDSSRLVQSAAIRAAGECGNPVVLDGLQDQSAETAKGLRPLLAQTQGATRFAVIRSMSRLGDHQAMQELVRMSFDANPATRLDVVRAMGDTGHSRFVEPLVRLAWTEPDHHVRQGAVAALERLVPVNQRPAGLANAKSLAETVSLWNDWWTAQARATGLRNAHEGTHDRYERQLSN